MPRAYIYGEARIVAGPKVATYQKHGEQNEIVSCRAVISSTKRDDPRDDSWWVSLKAFRGWEQKVLNQCEKGDLVAFSGRLSCNNWTNRDGEQRADNEVVLDQVSKIQRIDMNATPHAGASYPPPSPPPVTDDEPPF